MQTYIYSLWEYSKRFHCSFEWHLTPHERYLLKPVLGGHPVLSGHRIKRTPSIKRTVAEVPKFISLIYFK